MRSSYWWKFPPILPLQRVLRQRGARERRPGASAAAERGAVEGSGGAGALPVSGAGQGGGGVGAAAGVRHLPGRAPAGAAVQRGAGVPPHLPRGVYPRVGEEEEHPPAVPGQGRTATSGVRDSGRR